MRLRIHFVLSFLFLFCVLFYTPVFSKEVPKVSKDDFNHWQSLVRDGMKKTMETRFKEALIPFLEAEGFALERFGKEHPLYAESLSFSAQTYSALGDYSKAEAGFLKVLDLYNKLENVSEDRRFSVLSGLMTLYLFQNKPDKADKYGKEALKSGENFFGRNNPALTSFLIMYADVQARLNKTDYAEELYDRTVFINKDLLSKKFLPTAKMMVSVASFYRMQKKPEKAEMLLEQIIDIYNLNYESQNKEFIRPLTELAFVRLELNDFAESEKLFLQANKTALDNFKSYDQRLGYSYENLGLFYSNALQYKKSNKYYKSALEVFSGHNMSDYESYHRVLLYLAENHTNQEDYKQAELTFTDALNLLRIKDPKNQKEETYILGKLGKIAFDTGKWKKAEKYFLKALMLSKDSPDLQNLVYIGLMLDLAELYKKTGRFREAKKKFVEIERNALNIKNKKSFEYYFSLEILADYYEEQGDYAKTEDLLKEGLGVKEEVLGKNHIKIAKHYSRMGLFYAVKGDFDKADASFNKALKIADKYEIITGPSKFLYYEYANYCGRRGRNEEAEKVYGRVFDMIREVYGPDSLYYADSKFTMASFLIAGGKFDRAEKLMNEALIVFRKQYGRESLKYLNGRHSIVKLYMEKGNVGKAGEILLDIYKTLEQNRFDGILFIIVNKDLADVNLQLLNFREAEDYLEKYIDLTAERYGRKGLDYAYALNFKYMFLISYGKYSEAKDVLLKSLEIQKSFLKEEHPGISKIYVDLGRTYYLTGDNKQAEELFNKALKNQVKVLGEENMITLITEINLAHLYTLEGRFDDSEAIYNKSLNWFRKRYGNDHIYTYNSYTNLAALYRLKGDFDKSIDLYRKSIEGITGKIGLNNQSLIVYMNQLAEVLAVDGRKKEAFDYYNRVFELSEAQKDLILSILSEKSKLEYLMSITRNFHTFLSFIIYEYQENRECRIRGMDLILVRKGNVFDATSRERQAISGMDNRGVKELLEKRKDISSGLSSLILGGPGDENAAAYRDRISRLALERERIEKELLKLGYREFRRNRDVKVSSLEVSRRLPADSVLIEFILLRRYKFEKNTFEKNWDGLEYAAFILPSVGKDGKADELNPQIIPLGNAADIDRAVLEYHREVNRAKTHWKSGVLDEKESETRLAKKGNKLYSLVFLPLLEKVGGAKTLYVSPDGLLNLIPFDALVDENGNYLIEKYNFNYLSSGRDLLSWKDDHKGKGDRIIVAAPDYNLSDQARIRKVKELALEDRPFMALRGGSKPGKIQEAGWSELPQTKLEAEAISNIFRDRIKEYIDKNALEEVVKNLKSPQILHIATHGFFLQSADNMEMFTKTDLNPDFLINNKSVRAGALLENPLLKSGLILAGANSARIGQSQRGVDDGILTALEISELNLRGTDLVVLSACETGQGDVLYGEGVFGLRRAFQLAGARTVVMSLWSVPDLETKELMVDFYTRFNSGESKARALQNAELAMMKKRRKEKGAAHPFFWASFISVGEP